MSLSQVLDNHIQPILYMYNISQYVSDTGIVWLPVTGIGIGPKNSILVGPYASYSAKKRWQTAAAE